MEPGKEETFPNHVASNSGVRTVNNSIFNGHKTQRKETDTETHKGDTAN